MTEAIAAARGEDSGLNALRDLRDLREEIFGPILCVVRYAADRLDDLLAAIDATGYGLTLGIHSRIEATQRGIAERLRIGNTYVNRNQIGAVVGVQPFGGRGLSGTGPKAGGPHYLRRLVRDSAALAPEPGSEIVLPGPTGETNTLSFSPRGRVACLATNEADLRAQIEVALRAGK